jgi:hypothetical protein
VKWNYQAKPAETRRRQGGQSGSCDWRAFGHSDCPDIESCQKFNGPAHILFGNSREYHVAEFLTYPRNQPGLLISIWRQNDLLGPPISWHFMSDDQVKLFIRSSSRPIVGCSASNSQASIFCVMAGLSSSHNNVRARGYVNPCSITRALKMVRSLRLSFVRESSRSRQKSW